MWSVLLVYNGIVFAVYAWDKWRARAGGRRVPERTLLWLAALAGGPGAMAAIFGVRHKSRKPRFTVGVTVLTLAQVGLLLWGRRNGWW